MDTGSLQNKATSDLFNVYILESYHTGNKAIQNLKILQHEFLVTIYIYTCIYSRDSYISYIYKLLGVSTSVHVVLKNLVTSVILVFYYHLHAILYLEFKKKS